MSKSDRAKRGVHYRTTAERAMSARQPRPELRRRRTRKQAVLAAIRES